ncbi:hypothetical protein GCM10027425_29640 [Alteromonas gracilis]
MERVLAHLRSLDGVLELAPVEGDGTPPIAWGDHFLYYAPDGRVPQREQPFATIVTKDYPGDASSELDQPGRWRLNVHAGQDAVTVARSRAELDPSTADVLLPHPTYADQGWVCIVAPAPTAELLALLDQSYADAVRRAERRGGGTAAT